MRSKRSGSARADSIFASGNELMALLRAPSTCYVTTLMPDGYPQLTQTWVDTDGEHILINTVVGFQKLPVPTATSASAAASPPPREPPTTSRHSPTSTSAAPTPGTAAETKPAPP